MKCYAFIMNLFNSGMWYKGPFTNDVSGEGEGGGWPISDDRRRRLRDLYTKNSDKGGEGVKNLKNLADVIYERPLMMLMMKYWSINEFAGTR